MFDLVEHTKKYQKSDDSIDVEAMQQNNVDPWARSEELEIEILALAGQMNALRIRDGGYLYASCCQNHFTDAHHIKHWAEGGEASMENLVTLCRFHHGLLHKGEYCLHRDEPGDLVFTNSRNEVITRAFYPQFPDNPCADDCLDPDIDENTARPKWLGESMDIDHALQCMFQLE